MGDDNRVPVLAQVHPKSIYKRGRKTKGWEKAMLLQKQRKRETEDTTQLALKIESNRKP